MKALSKYRTIKQDYEKPIIKDIIVKAIINDMVSDFFMVVSSFILPYVNRC